MTLETGATTPSVSPSSVTPLPLFRPSKSMLFASVYPMDGDCFETLLLAVERLALNDASLEVEKESSTTLGNGLRIGFLGMLHMEVRVTLDVIIICLSKLCTIYLQLTVPYAAAALP
jgi:translation elongation factor EF-4